MSAKQSPFYVEPARLDTTNIMSGVTEVLDTTRKQNYKQRMKTAMTDAFQSGDPDKVQQFIADFPEGHAGLQAAMGFKDKKTQGNYMKTLRDVLSVRDLYGADSDPKERNDKIVAMLEARNEYVKSRGGDPVDTEEGIRNFMNDPEGFLQRAEIGYSAMASPQEYKAYQGLKYGGEVDPKFMEEERKTASQDVRAFNTKARNMRTSYGQLEGLANQAASGDRGARNAMMVTLARLISPGIVTEKEAGALAGGQNTMQYVMEALTSAKEGGAEFANVLKGFDPYGESFDSDAVLQIGESVVASGREPLIDMYEMSRSRAQRAGMRKKAFNTNFGENENYDFLQNFGGADKSAVQVTPAPAAAPAAAQAPAQQVKPAPAGAIEKLNANPELRDFFLQKYGYLPEGF